MAAPHSTAPSKQLSRIPGPSVTSRSSAPNQPLPQRPSIAPPSQPLPSLPASTTTLPPMQPLPPPPTSTQAPKQLDPNMFAAPISDLTDLQALDEYTIMLSLQKRFIEQHHIYTYIHDILLAINPFANVPIYDLGQINRYAREIDGRQSFVKLEPHIFALANASYRQLVKTGKNQSINISGESGAGKTESFKYIVRFLTNFQDNKHTDHAAGVARTIEDQIEHINPVLEAFGNAQTQLNNNSSRFGKFTYLCFENGTGRLVGAKFVAYLLEKSRIVVQPSDERNYHIFYYMLEGCTPSEKERYRLCEANAFRSLGQRTQAQEEDASSLEQVSEKEEDQTNLSTVLTSFEHVCLRTASTEEKNQFRSNIISMLAAVLHLGNLEFTPLDVSKSNASPETPVGPLEVVPDQDLQLVASLLGIDSDRLAQTLTYKTVSAASRSSAVTSPLSIRAAESKRDTLAKTLYERLFQSLLTSMNNAVAAPPGSANSFIGLLDIFGFEKFQTNDFEQFCINYANERLQAFFVDHVFQQEQSDYEGQGIPWTPITFNDNRRCVELFSQRPIGLLALLEEESLLPSGSPASIVGKFESSFKDHPNFVSIKTSKVSFAIKHFAGLVPYQTHSFLEKNASSLRSDILVLFAECTSTFVQSLFREDLAELSGANGNNTSSTSTLAKMKALDGSGNLSKDRKGTLTMQFKASLEDLMTVLGQTHPFFVRCIKSNVHKHKFTFDDGLVVQQLRYLGVSDCVHIRKSGYNYRTSFEKFLERHAPLLRSVRPRLMYGSDKQPIPPKDVATAEQVKDFLSSRIMYFGPPHIIAGTSKVFASEQCFLWLDRWMSRLLNRCARNLQRRWRTRMALQKQREQEAAIEAAMLVLQDAIRSLLCKTLIYQLQSAAQAATQASETTIAASQTSSDGNPEIGNGSLRMRNPESIRLRKEDKVKKLDQLIQSQTERAENLRGRKDGRFEELIRSEETLKVKLATSIGTVHSSSTPSAPVTSGNAPTPSSSTGSTFKGPQNKNPDQLPEPAETKPPAQPQKKFGLFSSRSESKSNVDSGGSTTKTKADLFEDMIKSDKTVKISLRGQNKNESSSSSPPVATVAGTSTAPTPTAPTLSSDLAAAADNVRTRKERSRSRTISDVRTVNQMLAVNALSSQVIGWLEVVLMETITETDLINCIQNGNVLVRLALLIRPDVPCKFAAKGDAFALQKTAFFLDCCHHVGVPHKLLYSINDMKNGNLAAIVNTFVDLSVKLHERGWSSPALQTIGQAAKAAPLVESTVPSSCVDASDSRSMTAGSPEEADQIEEERSKRLSSKLQRLSMTPVQFQNLLAQTSTTVVAPAGIVPVISATNKPKVQLKTSDASEQAITVDSGDSTFAGPGVAAYNELISTEKAYINDLRVVIQHLDVARRKLMITKEASMLLFSNIEELLSIHQILLKNLEEKPQRIGETFSKMTDYLKVYNVYCANFPSASAFLSRMRENDPLKVYLNTFTALDDSGGLSIETFLMKPVQRICRYPLLLKRLADLTPNDSTDKGELGIAIAKVEAVVTMVNESRRQKENSERMLELQSQLFVGSDRFSLLSPARKFVLDGGVWKIFPGDKLKDRHLFLFNDLLILATPQGKKRDKFNVKFSVDLADVQLLEDPDEPLNLPTVDATEEDETRRAQINAAIQQFNNEKPAKAVSALLDQGIVENSPDSVASFLLRTPELSKVGVGEYLGGPAPFQRETLRAYLNLLDMTALRFDEALRAFLATFRLPGEAQIIDRMMESFSARYCEANPEVIPGGADMAHTLVFAIIMLNTSLHNPNVDRKMSLDDFVYNFRNADEAAVVSDSLLQALYRSIRDEKLEMGLDDDSGDRQTISFSNMPQRLCLGVPSLAIVVTLPAPHPTMRLKLSGQGLLCEPAVLSFIESSTAKFVVTGLTLGRRTLLITRVGKGARLFLKPAPVDLLVQLPMLQHTLMMEVAHRSVKETTKEIVRLGVPTREERLQWHTNIARCVEERQRQVVNRTTRSGSALSM